MDMKTKQKICKEHLGKDYVKKIGTELATSIHAAMEEYKSQNDFPIEAFKGGSIKVEDYPKVGIVVDGSTTGGNPGQSEYQAFDLATGKILFTFSIGKTTNNVTEYIALVHAIKYSNNYNLSIPIYSDSNTAISWIEKNQVNSEKQYDAASIVRSCIKYLKTIDIPEIKKWNTREWGENPADFGRK